MIYTTEKTKAPTQEDGATANFNTDFSTQNDTTQAVSVEERIEMATKFLSAMSFYLHYDKDYYTYLWLTNDNENLTVAFNSQNGIEKAARTAIEYNDKGYSVYFGVNLTDKPFGKHERPKKADITTQVAIVADLDCKSAWHTDSEVKKYPTIEQAKTFLPFEPSILIDSGGGLHSYILLKQTLKENQLKNATKIILK